MGRPGRNEEIPLQHLQAPQAVKQQHLGRKWGEVRRLLLPTSRQCICCASVADKMEGFALFRMENAKVKLAKPFITGSEAKLSMELPHLE